MKRAVFFEKDGVLKTRVFGKRTVFLKGRGFENPGFWKKDGVFERTEFLMKRTVFLKTRVFDEKDGVFEKRTGF